MYKEEVVEEAEVVASAPLYAGPAGGSCCWCCFLLLQPGQPERPTAAGGSTRGRCALAAPGKERSFLFVFSFKKKCPYEAL